MMIAIYILAYLVAGLLVTLLAVKLDEDLENSDLLGLMVALWPFTLYVIVLIGGSRLLTSIVKYILRFERRKRGAL